MNLTPVIRIPIVLLMKLAKLVIKKLMKLLKVAVVAASGL